MRLSNGLRGRQRRRRTGDGARADIIHSAGSFWRDRSNFLPPIIRRKSELYWNETKWRVLGRVARGERNYPLRELVVALNAQRNAVHPVRGEPQLLGRTIKRIVRIYQVGVL